MQRFFIIYFFIFSFFYFFNLKATEIKIIKKIGNDIITNIDIENEYKYLTTLNQNYKTIEKEKIYIFLKLSLINEKIKKSELKKYFELGVRDVYLDQKIEEIYVRLGHRNLSDFKTYLLSNDLQIENIYKKIEIELKWNKLIFDKYKNQIIINKENLKKKLILESKERYSYNISELVFSIKNKSEFKKKYKDITKSIKDIGFEKTVLIYSISESIDNSGNIGWINQISLSKVILEQLEKISISEITKPIKIPNGIIILKLNDKKKTEKIDESIDNELSKLVKFERNRQLNIFSSIYFNKIKKKIFTDES